MAKVEDTSFQFLLQQIDLAVSGQSSLPHLQQVLRHHKPSFLALLADVPRNEGDKARVMSGEVPIRGTSRRVEKSTAEQAVALSEGLELNEIECVDLLLTAKDQAARMGYDVPTAAVHLHFRERECLVMALLVLLKQRMDTGLPEEMRSFIVAYTNDLMAGDLATRLLEVLHTLAQPLPESAAAKAFETGAFRQGAKDRVHYRARECKLVAMCLFYLCYQTQITSEQVQKLLRTARAVSQLVHARDTAAKAEAAAAKAAAGGTAPMGGAATSASGFPAGAAGAMGAAASTMGTGAGAGAGGSAVAAVAAQQQHKPPTVHERAVAHVASVLLLCVAESLDLVEERYQPKTGALRRNALGEDTRLPSFMESELVVAEWENGEYQSVLRFVWGLFLHVKSAQAEGADEGVLDDKYRQDVMNAAFDGGVFAYLRRVLAARTFRSDSDNVPFLIDVAHQLLTTFLRFMLSRVHELQLLEQRALEDAARLDEELRPEPSPVWRYGDATSVAAAAAGGVGGGGGVDKRPGAGGGAGAGADGPKTPFSDLVLLLAELHREQPQLAAAFWNYNAPGCDANFPLFKFINFAGDSVPMEQFAPYLRLLTALACGPECASYVHWFLQNGTNPLVSWDHFFGSMDRYFKLFHEDESMGAGAMYAWAPGARGNGSGSRGAHASSSSASSAPGGGPMPRRMMEIAPKEQQGLAAMLALIAQVVRNNEEIRMVLFENQQWHVVYTVFGLLACPLPPFIKAELFAILAAFAETAEIGGHIWMQLEASQVLPTWPQHGMRAGATQERGIRVELREIESRHETYPEMRAFVHLLDVLVRSRTPPNLGAGYRVPGTNPYVDFVRNDVLMRFDQLEYREPSEMWQVAAAALRVLHGVLRAFHVAEEDFRDDLTVDVQGGTQQAARSPGSELLRVFLAGASPNGSTLLNKLLRIVGEMERLHAQRFAMPQGDALEEAVLHGLKVIELLLTHDVAFIELNNRSSSTDLLTPLDELLLRRREAVVHIAQYVNYPHHPELGLCAIRILHMLSQRQHSTVALLLEAGVQQVVVDGFVHRLEQPDNGELMLELAQRAGTASGVGTSEDAAADAQLVYDMGNAARHAILSLLLDSLDLPAPNLTHLLLGFNLTRAISATRLEASTTRSCLHVVLQLLSMPTFAHEHPRLCADCFQLVYRLCANEVTSTPMIKCLRTQDFFYKHLLNLDTRISAPIYIHQLPQLAWLMKCIALELHLAGTGELEFSSNNRRYLSLLYGGSSLESQEEASRAVLDDSVFRHARPVEQQMKKILEVLDALQLDFDNPPTIEMHRLHHVDVQACKRMQPSGVALIDINVLHAQLVQAQREYEHAHGVGDTQGHQSELSEETMSVLRQALAWNQYYELFHAKVQAFEAWKHVVEVTLLRVFEQMEEKDVVLYELVMALLQRLMTVWDPIASSMAGVVKMVLHKLREHTLFYEVVNPSVFRRLPAEHCHTILRGLLECIARVGSSQEMRGNLYAALFNYLQYTRRPSFSLSAIQQETNTLLLLQHAEDAERRQAALENGNHALLEGAGTRLMEVMCGDTADGMQEGWRTVAFAALDALMAYDRQGRWLQFLCNKGFLHHYLEALSTDGSASSGGGGAGASLADVLADPPQSLDQLYVYQSKMSLFLHLAQSREGALGLLEYGVVKHFVSSRWIELRPVANAASVAPGSWLPPVHERYQQLFVPLLQLLNALLTSMPRNESAASQITELLNVHHKVINHALKDQRTHIDAATMDEVREVTLLLAQVVTTQAYHAQMQPARASKFVTLMVELLVKYGDRKRWESTFVSHGDGDAAMMSDHTGGASDASLGEARLVAHAICRNVLTFLRGVTHGKQKLALGKGEAGGGASPVGGGNEGKASVPNGDVPAIFFAPSLSPHAAAQSSHGTVAGHAPPLSVLSRYLDVCVQELIKVRSSRSDLRFQLSHANEEAPTGELLVSVEKAEHTRLQAQVKLLDAVVKKKRENQLLLYVVENTLLLLYHHLGYFMQARTPGKVGLTVSLAEVEGLERDAASSLLPVLSHLQHVQSEGGDGAAGGYAREFDFSNALVRRLRDCLLLQDAPPMQ